MKETTLPTNLIHELRGELSVILLCCSTLRHELGKALPEEQLQGFYRIERSSAKIHDLTKQLHGSSQVDEQAEVVTKRPRTQAKLPAFHF